MAISRLKMILLSCLLLGGCVPKTGQEEAMLETTCPCPSSPEEEVFARGDWPKENWWEAFEDPALSHLIEKALVISPTLQKAEARVKGALEAALIKRARLFPEIDFNASTNWQHLSKSGFFREYAPVIPPAVNEVIVNFSFNYEFDFWGKNRMLFEAALGEAAALYAEKKQAELIITTSIAYSYLQVQLLLREIALLQKFEKNSQEIASIRSKRQKTGIDNAIVRLQSDRRALEVESGVLELQTLLEAEIHQLKALAGLGQDQDLDLILKEVAFPPITLPENLSLELIARRPDLAAQKARVTAAAKEIGAAKTAFYPNVNLMAFLGLDSVIFSSLFSKNGVAASVFPALTLPIFTAGRLTAQLKERVENFNQAVFGYNEMILKIAQEIANRLTAISLLQKQIQVQNDAVRFAKEEALLAKHRVEMAIDDRIQFLEAENVVLEFELILTYMEYGKQLANIQLIRSLGGGYHE